MCTLRTKSHVLVERRTAGDGHDSEPGTSSEMRVSSAAQASSRSGYSSASSSDAAPSCCGVGDTDPSELPSATSAESAASASAGDEALSPLVVAAAGSIALPVIGSGFEPAPGRCRLFTIAARRCCGIDASCAEVGTKGLVTLLPPLLPLSLKPPSSSLPRLLPSGGASPAGAPGAAAGDACDSGSSAPPPAEPSRPCGSQ